MREFIDVLDEHPFRKVVAMVVVLAGLAALVVAGAGVVRQQLSDPQVAGRQARDVAEGWNDLVADNFDETLQLDQSDGAFGSGSGVAGDGSLRLNGLSEISHAVPWVVYPDVPETADFYMQVSAQLTDGPSDIGCGLIFAWQDPESWWGVRLVDRSTFLVSRFEGERNERIDARTFHGPTEVDGADIREGARLAVQRIGDEYAFFVDDRLIVELDAELLLEPSGSPAPFAVDTSSLYRASYRCEFAGLRVWTR